MKQGPDICRIVERMAPGALSRDGFLGDDRRPLEEIIESDLSAVLDLNSSHRRLAEKLQQVFAQARSGLGTTVELNDRLTAAYPEAMGRIRCPWGGCGSFAKGQVELTDAATNQRIVFTALGLHMIAEHGFYQGQGSKYRLEPAQIHDIFGM